MKRQYVSPLLELEQTEKDILTSSFIVASYDDACQDVVFWK